MDFKEHLYRSKNFYQEKRFKKALISSFASLRRDNALLRLYNFSNNPEKLEDEERADLIGQMYYALECTGRITVERKKGLVTKVTFNSSIM